MRVLTFFAFKSFTSQRDYTDNLASLYFEQFVSILATTPLPINCLPGSWQIHYLIVGAVLHQGLDWLQSC